MFIGNYQAKYFKKSTPENRRDALTFLARDDVEVLGWYRRHGQSSDAHLKVWIAQRDDGPPAILNGSANLSDAGLYHNHEIMTSVPEEEVGSVALQVGSLLENAWEIKSKVRDYIQGRARRFGPRQVPPLSKPTEEGTRTRRRRYPVTQPRHPKRTRNRGGCGCGTFVIGLLALMSLLYLINNVIPALNFTNDDVRSESALSGTTQSVERTQTNGGPSIHGELPGQDLDRVPANSSTLESPNGSAPPEQPASHNPTTTSQEQTLELDPLTGGYVQGIIEVQAVLQTVLEEIHTISRDWDNRNETGLAYAEAEATLIAINEQVQSLNDSVRYQRVPIVLRGIHGEPGGPVQQSAKLPPLVEAVIEGLQIPAPNDGSERREALLEFDAAAQSFFNSVEHVLRHIEKNAVALGLTNSPVSTTTTHPPVPLSDEGVAYVEGLMKFKEILGNLVFQINAANEAWDDRATTNFSFSETESTLGRVAEQAQAFHKEVREFPVPQPIRVLGEDPPRKSALIPETASRVLAGLQIPAPDPGFERLAALDDFNAAAQRFIDSVNHVISEVHAKAHTSGLAKEG